MHTRFIFTWCVSKFWTGGGSMLLRIRTSRSYGIVGCTTAPEPGEAGWKDTARADPGMITRIIVPFEGFVGRYVWHCHILEHEDNEMMRPFEVIRKQS